MKNKEIVKAKALLEYSRKLMNLVDYQYYGDLAVATEDEISNIMEEIEVHFKELNDGYILDNSYEGVKKYHYLTLDTLNHYLYLLNKEKDNDTVYYIIKQLNSVLDIVNSYEINQFDTKNKLVSFDLRTYFKAVTVLVTKTLCESLELLIHRLESDRMLESFIFAGIDCLKRLHIYTISCNVGDEWDASLFELEPLTGNDFTENENLVNKICKVHRKVFLIRYGNTYYKLIPGIVSLWRTDE